MKKLEDEAEIQIELNESVAQGIYSNLSLITHSSSEFVIDFLRVMPGVPKAGVKSRIIMAPEHVKYLMMALHENLRKYEEKFGTIELHNENSLPPMYSLKGEA